MIFTIGKMVCQDLAGLDLPMREDCRGDVLYEQPGFAGPYRSTRAIAGCVDFRNDDGDSPDGVRPLSSGSSLEAIRAFAGDNMSWPSSTRG